MGSPLATMGRAPAECARGHLNDPYPETGRCSVCNIFLPANPAAITSETAAEFNRNRTLMGADRRKRLKKLIVEAGWTMDTVPELLLMYAETAVKTGSTSDYDKFAQQSQQYKPAPRSGPEDRDPTLEVVILAESIDHIRRSIEWLSKI